MRRLFEIASRGALGWGFVGLVGLHSGLGCSADTPCNEALQFIIDNCGESTKSNLDPEAKPSCAPLQLEQAEAQLACYRSASDVEVVCAIELARDPTGLDPDEFERVSDCLADALVKE